MPDIFGREFLDYQHLQALQRSGYLEQAQLAWAQERAGHNFNALSAMGRVHTRIEDAAQAIGYMTNNLQAVMAQVEEILYTRNRLAEMVPLAMDVPDGAATYSYRVIDRVGLGRFIEYDGTSAPSAMAAQTLVPYRLHYAGIIADWTLEDVRQAMFGGFPLDTETIEAATTGALNHMEMVGFSGDVDRGMRGLINQPVPTIDTAPTGNQVRLVSAADRVEDMSADTMLNFLQQITTDIVTNSEEVLGTALMGELCIYMPLNAAATVSQTRLPDTGRTIWEYFQMNNTWASYTGRPPMLKWLKELSDAGTISSGNNNRYIWAVKDRRIMEMAVPIMPRVLSIAPEGGYKICAPMEYKISGLNMKRPSTIIYVDPN